MEELIHFIKRGPLYSRKRQLLINPEFIQFENEDIFPNQFTRIDKDEIKECRFGIIWIRGISDFVIGRDYQIYIRDQDDKVLKIKFKTFYGIGKSKLHNQYVDIVNALWENYLRKMAEDFLNKFYNNHEFDIGDVHFSKDNITIKSSGLFKEQKRSIHWGDVATRDYVTYFAIYSISDPANSNRGYSYLNDWNTTVLYSVVKTIIDEINSRRSS